MSQMSSQPTTQVDQELVGEPMQVGAYTLQPLAHAKGRMWSAPEGAGRGVFMRLTPTAVRVTDQDGTESMLSIPSSPEKEALLGMAAGAAVIAVVSILTMLVALFVSRR